MIYWNTLDSKQVSLLHRITENIAIEDAYLAGGTALSLQMGLRKSRDFEFFVPHSFSPEDLYRELHAVCPDETSRIPVDSNGTCDIKMEDVQVRFCEYTYNLICNAVSDREIHLLNMASIRDIAAMKAMAIGGRGSKKDFFDLYQIFQRSDYDMHTLVTDMFQKYGDRCNFSYVGMGMVYFKDAEAEVLPDPLINWDWNQVKEFFSNGQKDFFLELYSHQNSSAQ